VGGVFVNMAIDTKASTPDAAEFLRNRVVMQQHLQTIDDSVRAIVPLFETEVRGVPMLQRLSAAMFAADGAAATPAPNASISRSHRAGARP
jgi:hypothetical protein